MSNTMSVESALALDGRIFAMLTPAELELFKFYRDQGRKYGVVATIVSAADPGELAQAKTQAHQDEVMRRVNSTVSVVRSTTDVSFFLKTVPYALLLAGAAFMALLVAATQTGSLLFGCCALLVLASALFMARMVGTRLASTPRAVAMPVGTTVVGQAESVKVGPSSVTP